ncbi:MULTISPECIES: hypothetical protein [Falsihalocynthiibacter]|uniref:hypothetical protein n=1 Tax=Falsihalocynthiibacter TaxID=2854182 RepID=UPI003002A7C6
MEERTTDEQITAMIKDQEAGCTEVGWFVIRQAGEPNFTEVSENMCNAAKSSGFVRGEIPLSAIGGALDLNIPQQSIAPPKP